MGGHNVTLFINEAAAIVVQYGLRAWHPT